MADGEDNGDGAPRFRNKPIEVTLYDSFDEVGYEPAFEGQTSSVSREGVGVRVVPRGEYKSVDFDELKGESFVVRFHTAGRDIPDAEGRVEMVGESHDMRYKVYLGFVFEDELPIHNLLG